jgi:biopolymer transport protein ExbB
MDLIIHSIKQDWLVLLPILVCSILVMAVVINRFSFYNQNKRDIIQFIQRLQRELNRNNLEGAQILSAQLGGVIGDVAEEGIRVLSEQKKEFSRSFDITTSLAVRKLEKHLTILGTIGSVCPFLGLFATVVRILYTFQDLASQGNQSAAVAMGIGSALIATAFGLGVAIVAVVFFNSFQSIVRRYEDDFQLLKLLFLSFVDSDVTAGKTLKQVTEEEQVPAQAVQPGPKAFGSQF